MALVTAGDRASNASPEVLFDCMTAYSGRYRLQGNNTFVAKVRHRRRLWADVRARYAAKSPAL